MNNQSWLKSEMLQIFEDGDSTSLGNWLYESCWKEVVPNKTSSLWIESAGRGRRDQVPSATTTDIWAMDPGVNDSYVRGQRIKWSVSGVPPWFVLLDLFLLLPSSVLLPSLNIYHVWFFTSILIIYFILKNKIIKILIIICFIT
jgi:hypothetical protein